MQHAQRQDARHAPNEYVMVHLPAVLNHSTVPSVRTQLLQLLVDKVNVRVDLSRVSTMDTAAIAVFVECLRVAKDHGVTFAVTRPTECALRLLRLTKLDQLLNESPSCDSRILSANDTSPPKPRTPSWRTNNADSGRWNYDSAGRCGTAARAARCRALFATTLELIEDLKTSEEGSRSVVLKSVTREEPTPDHFNLQIFARGVPEYNIQPLSQVPVFAVRIDLEV